MLALGAVAMAVALPSFGVSSAGASPATVNFAFIGDMPYTALEVAKMPAFVADVNADAAVQFTAHSGDFKGGNDSCGDAEMLTTFTSFNSLAKPFWYTPGDNDWTDCHRNTNGNHDPLERLAHVRGLYFATPGQTIGQTTMAVHTQQTSATVAFQPFVENTWFNKECVTFGAVHSVTSANGLLHPDVTPVTGKSSLFVDPNGVAAGQAARDAEVTARTAADIAWIDQIFSAAAANQSEGVFLMLQAEPATLATTPGSPNDIVSGADEFAGIRAEIISKAGDFGKPVVIAHGDQHAYTVTQNYGGVANITRLENFGSAGAASKWVQVQADCSTAAVFSQRPRTVATAAGTYAPMFAAAPPVDVPEGPLSTGLAALGVAALGAYGIRVRRGRAAV